ncbi:hypothetical protein KVE69_03305 [Helicobacter pylori]|uniref:hypothetical protein n=1 Tax=Helicobacter pylori TaxID=210 RepID=UPI0001F47078|nr:hypothetical protein [Helicobacter pylori]WRC21343.1 hypothetical protein KVE69_03305 [Helicobacter pylori]BAJ59734.1 hypothetical protein HPF57_0660 [Helicobacter pylori F57]
MIEKDYIRGDLVRIVKNLFLVLFVAYSSAFAVDLEIEAKKDKKSNKKLYYFTKNSALEGINLEKSPTLKSHKKSDKKFYKQLPKNRISEGVSMPVVNFNKTLSFGPYFERTKSKKTQYMDGGLMMHIRF